MYKRPVNKYNRVGIDYGSGGGMGGAWENNEGKTGTIIIEQQ